MASTEPPKATNPQQSNDSTTTNNESQAEPLTRTNNSNPRKVQPNKMSFTDAQGVRHEIHMPKGTFEQACRLFIAEDWEELAKFPKWSRSEL